MSFCNILGECKQICLIIYKVKEHFNLMNRYFCHSVQIHEMKTSVQEKKIRKKNPGHLLNPEQFLYCKKQRDIMQNNSKCLLLLENIT